MCEMGERPEEVEYTGDVGGGTMLVITVVEMISVVIVEIISVETLVDGVGTVELSEVGYVIGVVEPVWEELL